MIHPLESKAREYFLNGGGGFEDGKDGARAASFTFEGMVYMAAAFAEHVLEEQDQEWRKNWSGR